MWIEMLTTHISELGSFLKGENRDVNQKIVHQLPKGVWKPSTAPWERQVDPLQRQIDQAHENFRKAQQDLTRCRQERTGLEGELSQLTPEIETLDAVIARGPKKAKKDRLHLIQRKMHAERDRLAAEIELAKIDIAELETVVNHAKKSYDKLLAQKAPAGAGAPTGAGDQNGTETSDQEPDTGAVPSPEGESPSPEGDAEG